MTPKTIAISTIRRISGFALPSSSSTPIKRQSIHRGWRAVSQRTRATHVVAGFATQAVTGIGSRRLSTSVTPIHLRNIPPDAQSRAIVPVGAIVLRVEVVADVIDVVAARPVVPRLVSRYVWRACPLRVPDDRDLTARRDSGGRDRYLQSAQAGAMKACVDHIPRAAAHDD